MKQCKIRIKKKVFINVFFFLDFIKSLNGLRLGSNKCNNAGYIMPAYLSIEHSPN